MTCEATIPVRADFVNIVPGEAVALSGSSSTRGTLMAVETRALRDTVEHELESILGWKGLAVAEWLDDLSTIGLWRVLSCNRIITLSPAR